MDDNISNHYKFIFQTAKQDRTSKSRKISFDCQTYSSNDDKALIDDNSNSSGYASNETQDEEETIPTLDDIRDLRRGCQVPREGLMCDLLWADPQVSILKNDNVFARNISIMLNLIS